MALINKEKRKNSLERVKIPEPTETVSRLEYINKMSAPLINKDKKKKQKKETTTIRCDSSISDKINALSILLDLNSVNDTLDYLINKEISTFTEVRLKEMDSIETIYRKKRSLKNKK